MSRSGISALLLLAIFGLAVLMLRLPGVPTTSDAAEAPQVATEEGGAVDRGPILVELFTSQGCSSCPPADRLLSRLSDDAEVIPLAFHVDYWDYIGWKDPFSTKAWSKRQEDYARSMKTGRLYTPQLVVDGREHCVGSRPDDVEDLLAQARARMQTGRIDVVGELDATGRRLDLAIGGRSTGEVKGRDLDLMLAMVESDLETAVTRGENAQRSLHNDHVVRRLKRLSAVRGGDAAPLAVDLTVDLENDWQTENLRAVVFLQDPKTRWIYGVGQWSVGGS